MFTLRFDMRAPGRTPAETAALYEAALEMAAWGERHGCTLAMVSEHHGSEDGYLPAPLVLAAAMAGRTRTLPIQVTALLVPLHDPIELAERMAVLDLASGGRVSYVCALGYRSEEYAMFGRDMRRRGRRMEACLEAMRRAWTGEPFAYEGRPVRVTPQPRTPGGPTLWIGGTSEAAARRAARFGLGFFAERGDPALAEAYRDECARHGREPGPCILPPEGLVTTAFVAEDPERAWREIGPHLLHDARAYAAWMGEGHEAASRSGAESVEALRAQGAPYRIFTPQEAVEHVRRHGILMLQPLCGGTPPELAWRSLELVEREVLPALRTPAPATHGAAGSSA